MRQGSPRSVKTPKLTLFASSPADFNPLLRIQVVTDCILWNACCTLGQLRKGAHVEDLCR